MENTDKQEKFKVGYVEFLARIEKVCDECGHDLLDFSNEYDEEHRLWVLKIKTN